MDSGWNLQPLRGSFRLRDQEHGDDGEHRRYHDSKPDASVAFGSRVLAPRRGWTVRSEGYASAVPQNAQKRTALAAEDVLVLSLQDFRPAASLRKRLAGSNLSCCEGFI